MQALRHGLPGSARPVPMTPACIFPNFDPVAVHLGPLSIRWYALAYITGLVLGWRLMRRLAQEAPVVATPVQVDDFLTWATLGVVLGGRLGYVLFYQPGQYLAHPASILAVWQGGMSFHGGVLGVVVALLIFTRREPHSPARLRRPARRLRADRARARADREFHQRRALGPPGARLAALGDDLSQCRSRAPPSERDLPGDPGRPRAVHRALRAVAGAGAAGALRLAHRRVPDRLRASPASSASSSASPTPSSATCRAG